MCIAQTQHLESFMANYRPRKSLRQTRRSMLRLELCAALFAWLLLLIAAIARLFYVWVAIPIELV
jgi:hypothetical protein